MNYVFKPLPCILAILLVCTSAVWAGRYSFMNGAISAYLWVPDDEFFEEDMLRYKGKAYFLCRQSPLQAYLTQEGWTELLSQDLNDSTWRGYKSRWVIEDGALYMTHFNSPNTEIEQLFQDLLTAAHQRWLAYWVTGAINIPLDKQAAVLNERRYICDSDGGERVLQLQFEHGLLKNARRVLLKPSSRGNQ